MSQLEIVTLLLLQQMCVVHGMLVSLHMFVFMFVFVFVCLQVCIVPNE